MSWCSLGLPCCRLKNDSHPYIHSMPQKRRACPAGLSFLMVNDCFIESFFFLSLNSGGVFLGWFGTAPGAVVFSASVFGLRRRTWTGRGIDEWKEALSASRAQASRRDRHLHRGPHRVVELVSSLSPPPYKVTIIAGYIYIYRYMGCGGADRPAESMLHGQQ